jgi:hypothetical protein
MTKSGAEISSRFAPLFTNLSSRFSMTDSILLQFSCRLKAWIVVFAAILLPVF